MAECWCGCGRSIDGMPKGTRYHPKCAPRVKAERKREVRRASENRVGPKTIVISERGPDNPRKPQPKQCKLCCDVPWARATDRLDESWEPIGVVCPDGVVRCRACWERYAEGPTPRRCSVLSSSAGTAAQHGALFGVST